MSEQEITKELTFITPALLAGADQNAPEIRAPSIRGALRWWFRVLAGGRDVREEEEELFGGVHGSDGPVASAISVRVETPRIVKGSEPLYRDEKKREGGVPRNESAMNYITYFAWASGKKKDKGEDKKKDANKDKDRDKEDDTRRTDPFHYIGEGSTFTLKIRAVRPVRPELWARLEEAVKAFVWVGALGLRATRGFGRLAEPGHLPTAQAFRDWAKALRASGIFFYEGQPGSLPPQAFLADQLKSLRRDCDLRPNDPYARALGAATKEQDSDRQASALRLCPVRTADAGTLPFFLYTDNACEAASVKTRVDAFCQASSAFTAL